MPFWKYSQIFFYFQYKIIIFEKINLPKIPAHIFRIILCRTYYLGIVYLGSPLSQSTKIMPFIPGLFFGHN
jgi:hypothetical protein